MDWIRRNWPDLLIGFALLAVISGIVATLLTGGSFFPIGGGGSQDNPSPTVSQTQNLPGNRNQTNNAAAGQNQSTDSGLADLPLLGTDDATDSTTDTGIADDGPVDPFAVLEDDPQELPTVVALRPGASEPGADTGEQTAANQGAAAAAEATTDTSPAQPAAQTQQDAPATSQQQVTSGDSPSEAVPYTVGVGAFRDAGNAERQAGVFRQAGYPVVVATQDDLTVVLLGPYATQSEAERVRDAVVSGGFGVSPLVYTYQGEDDGAATSSAATPEPAATTPPASSPAATDTSQPEPATSATAAGRWLQVGAYSSPENAAAQADVLEGLGYGVTQQQDGNLIRVLVGPYADGQLAAARDRLAAQGIDSVPR